MTFHRQRINMLLIRLLRYQNRSRHSVVHILFYIIYLMSTFAVASSMTNILFPCKSARARQTSCRCPILKFVPPSDNSVSKPWGSSATASFNSTCTKIASSLSFIKHLYFFGCFCYLRFSSHTRSGFLLFTPMRYNSI